MKKLGFFFLDEVSLHNYVIHVPFILFRAIYSTYGQYLQVLIPELLLDQFSRINASRFEDAIAAILAFRMNLLCESGIDKKDISLKEFFPNALAHPSTLLKSSDNDPKILEPKTIPVSYYSVQAYDSIFYSNGKSIKGSISELDSRQFFENPLKIYMNKPLASSFDILFPHPGKKKCLGLISLYSSESITTNNEPSVSQTFESKLQEDFEKSINNNKFIGADDYYLAFISNQEFPLFEKWKQNPDEIPFKDRAIIYCNQNIQEFLGFFGSSNLFQTSMLDKILEKSSFESLLNWRKKEYQQIYAERAGISFTRKDSKFDLACKIFERYNGSEKLQIAKRDWEAKQQKKKEEKAAANTAPTTATPTATSIPKTAGRPRKQR